MVDAVSDIWADVDRISDETAAIGGKRTISVRGMTDNDDLNCVLSFFILNQQILNDVRSVKTFKGRAHIIACVHHEAVDGACKHVGEQLVGVHDGGGGIGVGSVVQVEGISVRVGAHGKDWHDVVGHNLQDEGREHALDVLTLFGRVGSRRENIAKVWDVRPDLVEDVLNGHIEVEQHFLDGLGHVDENGRNGTGLVFARLLALLHAGHDVAAAVLRARLGKQGASAVARVGRSGGNEGAKSER